MMSMRTVGFLAVAIFGGLLVSGAHAATVTIAQQGRQVFRDARGQDAWYRGVAFELDTRNNLPDRGGL